MKDQWTAKLPDGEEVDYQRTRLANGKFKTTAQKTHSKLLHSRVVNFPVERKDVEILFLTDLMY